MVIEEELNELRSKNGPSWETTKYHLKLAKTNTSLRNIEQLTLVNGNDVDPDDIDDYDEEIREEGKNGRIKMYDCPKIKSCEKSDSSTGIIKNGAQFSQSETQFIENAS